MYSTKSLPTFHTGTRSISDGIETNFGYKIDTGVVLFCFCSNVLLLCFAKQISICSPIRFNYIIPELQTATVLRTHLTRTLIMTE